MTAGWWFWQEFAGTFWPGEPPPYSIELADEIRTHGAPIRWSVFRDDKPILTPPVIDQKVGYSVNEISYEAKDESYTLNGKFEFTGVLTGGPAQVRKVLSMYHITPTGALRSLRVEVVVELRVAVLNSTIRATVEGDVVERHLRPHWRIETPWAAPQNLETEPVEVSSRGSVLNPLHPVNRIRGLRPGQSWRMPLLDPLADSISARVMGTAPGARYLQAAVLAETQLLDWNQAKVPCLVITYRGDDTNAATWVRRSDGMVLQQEVISHNAERLVLQRDY
jgi:hypothetical protein